MTRIVKILRCFYYAARKEGERYDHRRKFDSKEFETFLHKELQNLLQAKNDEWKQHHIDIYLFLLNTAVLSIDEIWQSMNQCINNIINNKYRDSVTTNILKILKYLQREADIEYCTGHSNLQRMMESLKSMSSPLNDTSKNYLDSLSKLRSQIPGKYKILVVDDLYATLKFFLYEEVKEPDFWFEFEATPKGACQRLKEEKFDLVILDICLNPFNPNDLTGIRKILKHVKENENLPVLIFSGLKDIKEVGSAFAEAYGLSYLAKWDYKPGKRQQFVLKFKRNIYELLRTYGKQEYKYGIIVSHGTDTMAWAHEILRYVLKNVNVNIVMTGSQLPLEKVFTASDGIPNLTNALRVASSLFPPGVYVVFNDGKDIFLENIQKVKKWASDAFIGKKVAFIERNSIKPLRKNVTISYKHLSNLVVQKTGGTIEEEPGKEGALIPTKEDWVGVYIASKGAQYRQKYISCIFALDSSNITPLDWKELVERIAQRSKTLWEEHLQEKIKNTEKEEEKKRIIKEEILKFSSIGEKEIYTDLANLNFRYSSIEELISQCVDKFLKISVDYSLDENIRMLFLTPFYKEEYYRKEIENASGVVILGYGAGNTNIREETGYSILPIIRDLVREKKIVVMCSQVPYGRYGFDYDVGRKPIESGALPSVDFSPQRCQVKLAYIEGHAKCFELVANEVYKDLKCPKLPDDKREFIYRLKKIAFLAGAEFGNSEEAECFQEIIEKNEDWKFPLLKQDILVNNSKEKWVIEILRAYLYKNCPQIKEDELQAVITNVAQTIKNER